MLRTIIELIFKYRVGFLHGLLVTFEMATVAWLCGIVIGVLAGYLSAQYKYISYLIRGMAFLLSGIPILVFLFWLHYPAQSLLGITVDPLYTATFMLSFINIVAVAEIVRHGIVNVPKQYVEVAKICGLSKVDIFRKIQYPLIIRHIAPAILTAQVSILHLTLFASLISVEEIFRISQRIISIEYKPVEVYSALGIFFLSISLPINAVAFYLKRKFSRVIDEK